MLVIYGEPPQCFSLTQRRDCWKGLCRRQRGTFVLSQEQHSWKGALCPAVQGSKPQHAGHYPQCLLEGSSFPPKYLALIFFSNTWLWFENYPLIDQKFLHSFPRAFLNCHFLWTFPQLFILGRCCFDVQIFRHFSVGYNQQMHCNSPQWELSSSHCRDVRSQLGKRRVSVLLHLLLGCKTLLLDCSEYEFNRQITHCKKWFTPANIHLASHNLPVILWRAFTVCWDKIVLSVSSVSGVAFHGFHISGRH